MVCYLCGHMLCCVMLCHAQCCVMQGQPHGQQPHAGLWGPSRQGGYWLGFIVLLINVSLIIVFFLTRVLEQKSNQTMEVGRGKALWNLVSVQFLPTIVSELNSQPWPPYTLSSPHLQITATLSFLSCLYWNSGIEPELGAYKDNFMKFCGRASE